MRRALLEELPALTKFYGVMPWHLERMTLREINEYRTQLAAYQRQAEQSNR